MLVVAFVLAAFAAQGAFIATMGMFPSSLSQCAFVGVFTGVWVFVLFAVFQAMVKRFVE